ncbi:MAG TPA: alpha/beta hydrolase [Tepidiformaceae bacterium]|nr:alpha/beta hydrolase [Tepidiformaceae bacterium]
MLRARISGMDIAYEDRGQGPALVLLHGFVSDHRNWQPQIDGLSDRFRVIVPDLPGCGLSADPPKTWRFPEYADWLADFLEAVGASPAHVAGLSWGAVLAQELYRRHPRLIDSLILAGGYAGWGPSLGWDVAKERLERCLRLSYAAPSELSAAMIGGMFSPAAPRDVVEQEAVIISQTHPSGFRTMSRAVAEVDTTEISRVIDVPTLLVWGEQDQRSPVFVAEAFRQGISGSRLVLIPGGHICNMESPDAFNRALIDFLATASPAVATG